MTRPRFLATLFSGGPLYYEGTFNGKPFTKHWAVLEKSDDSGTAFQFFLELDPKVAGSGGALVKQRCRLALDAQMRPVTYLTEAQGARVLLEFKGDEVLAKLPDGSSPKLPRGGAEFVGEANITGLDAVFYAMMREQGRLGDEAHFTLFLLNQLLVIPLSLKRTGEGVWDSGYGEVIHLDANDVLQTVTVAKQGIIFDRKPTQPLPGWVTEKAGTAPKEIIRYFPPKDATFRLEDVSFAAPLGPVGGSVTVPTGTGPFPAVIFLSGTGKHDRHGIAGEIDLGSHEIVDHLSNHGFVGLRFDTRGAGTTKGSESLNAGLDPLIQDAHAALAYMSSRPEVDRARICLLGHSQGGLVALALAADAKSPEIRAVALLACLGRKLPEVVRDQIIGQAKRINLTEEQLKKQLSEFDDFIEAVRAGKTFAPGDVPDHLIPFTRISDWMKEHMGMEAVDAIAKVRCPVLIDQGGRDFQVSVRDAELLEQAAKAAGVKVEKMIFDEVDHLFKPAPVDSKPEQYWDRSRRVDPKFLESLTDWLRRNT